MNPVDHPHGGVSFVPFRLKGVQMLMTMNRVTTSILVRRLPSPDTPPRVKRPVLLLREGRVFCVVRRRRRSKGAGFMVSLGWCYTGLLASIDGTAESRRQVAPRASTMAFGAQNQTTDFLCEEVKSWNWLLCSGRRKISEKVLRPASSPDLRCHVQKCRMLQNVSSVCFNDCRVVIYPNAHLSPHVK